MRKKNIYAHRVKQKIELDTNWLRSFPEFEETSEEELEKELTFLKSVCRWVYELTSKKSEQYEDSG